MSPTKPGHPVRFDFALEAIHGGLARGWVRDRLQPERRLQVTLVIDGEAYADWADIDRPDLARPGQPKVDCGFCIRFDRLEFKSYALLIDGHCLQAETSQPDTVPAPPVRLSAEEVATGF